VVEDIRIPSDRRPVVDLLLRDDFLQPLDRLGIETPGEIALSFILAAYDPATREYSAYTTRVQTSPITDVSEEQASADSGGTFDDLGYGRVRYRFGTMLPAGFNPTRTHTLAIYAERVIELDFFSKEYVDNVVESFRPDGQPLANVWAAADNATCNRCHADLGLHGGVRKNVHLCVTCHNSSTVDPDTGNTLDMKVMIHKIHRGAALGMPYQIIGFRQSVHDYSTVVYPQDIRNCQSCHNPELAGGSNWLLFPSRKACGSCHMNVDFETGEGHAGGAQASDQFCSSCHQPQGVREFDASIMGAHTIPLQSETLAGINAEFVDVVDTAPGERPTVTLRLFNDDGSPIDPMSLNTFILTVYWPTTPDYEELLRETVDVSRVMVAGDELIYTMNTPLPADAHGTGTIAIESRRLVTVNGEELREAVFNSTFDFSITDGMAVPRRAIVSQEKCHACHETLRLHGDQRIAVAYCVSCHKHDETDAEVRPAEEMPPEGIHFKWLIHNIHRGEELERDFTVYGFRSSVHNYNEVRYPGLLNRCEQCHDANNTLPLADDLPSTVTPRDFFSPMLPATAACLGCHSAAAAAAHAFVNTADFGDVVVESCTTCHGEGRDNAVGRVHAE
jgi:OmcA/MtrC family decaheme c-type cytochrome